MNKDEERELLDQYRGWLMRVASTMTLPSNTDDLMQEGWIALWQACETWNDESPLDWWLKFNAIGRMKKVVTRDWVVKKNTFFTVVEDASDFADDVNTSNRDMAYHTNEIATAVNTLSPTEREYIVLKFWCDLNYPEMKQHFGYQPQMLQHRSYKKLAKQLAHLENIYV